MSGQTYKADGRSALQIQLKTGSGVNWSTVGSGTGWVAELRPEGSPSVTAPSATFNITVSGATMTLTLSDPSPLLRGSRTTYGWALYDGAGAPILTDMAVELHDGYTHPSGTPSPSGATPVGTYTVDLGTATGNLVVETVWTGPQGPQGPQGPPGSGAQINDATASSTTVYSSTKATNTFASQSTVPAAYDTHNDARYPAIGNVVSLLAAPSGGDDDTATIQAALNAGGHVTTRSGVTYKLTGTTDLTLDVSKTRLVGRGITIDASGMTGGAALTLLNSSSAALGLNVFGGLEGIRFVGPGSGSSVTGIKVDSTYDLRQTQNHRLTFDSFGSGIYLGNQAYNTTFLGCYWKNCGTGLTSPAGMTNAGERMVFRDCGFSNNNLGVSIYSSSAEIVLDTCSIDYNVKQVEINAGHVYAQNCHIEAAKNTHTVSPISVTGDGGEFRMAGGILVFSGTATATAPYVVDNSATGTAGAWFRDVYLMGLQTTSGYFANDTGSSATHVEGMSYTTSNEVHLVSAKANRLIDGGFEQTSLVDNWYIAADSATITDPHTGTDIMLSVSTAQTHSGSQSLLLQKVYGAGTAAKMQLAVPLLRRSRVGATFWYAKPGTFTGNVYFGFYWATMKPTSNGVPAVAYSSVLVQTPVNFTSAATPWTQMSLGDPTKRAPSWATHFIIEVDAVNLTGPNGQIFIDDVVITEM